MGVVVPGGHSIAPDYEERLRSIRGRRRDHLMVVLFLTAFLPLGLWMGPRVRMSAWMVLAVVWVLYGIVWHRVNACRCPRCEAAFFRSGFYKTPLEPRCIHCGLPVTGPERKVVIPGSAEGAAERTPHRPPQ